MSKPQPDAAALGLPEQVRCVFCGGEETELHSAFGPQLSVATYWCRLCRSPFDWIKWQQRDAPADPPPDAG
ncbi:MAG: hypothetical protein ACRELX_11495 [Longimicrobiales bacterium]